MKCYNRLTGMEEVQGSGAAGYMTYGTAVEVVIHRVYPEEWCNIEDSSILPSHTDILEELKNPLEVKGSAQKIFRAGDVPDSWRLQLMGYMSVHNSDMGWLVIMNLFTRKWSAFRMVMDGKEREDHIYYIKYFEEQVLKAKEEENPEILKPLMKPDEEQAKECSNCGYRQGRKRKKLGLDLGCKMYVKKKRKTKSS